MSSTSVSGSRSGKRPVVIVLAVLGVLAIVYGIINLVVKGLPKALTLYSGAKSTNVTHPLHAVVALVIGVILIGLAWWQNRKA